MLYNNKIMQQKRNEKREFKQAKTEGRKPQKNYNRDELKKELKEVIWNFQN